MDQLGKVINLARGQLKNRKHDFRPVPVCACELGVARRVRPSPPAKVVMGFLPLSTTVSVNLYHQPPLGQSRDKRVIQLRVLMTFPAESSAAQRRQKSSR